MKTAILQVADTGPLESLVVMLKTAGYWCHLPNERLRGELRSLGCDNVTDVAGLVRSWGYDQPFPIPEAGPDAMQFADLYVDVKAHRNGSRVIERWPNLKGKVLWYRINGTAPEIVAGQGDEVNLEHPILTPNLWYRDDPKGNEFWNGKSPTGPNWGGMAYAIWPPYHRFHEHLPRHEAPFTEPLCFVHNLAGWGFGPVTEEFRRMGVRCHGVRSPDGLLSHRDVLGRLTRAVCMVHMKSSDAPGYALYEAMAAGCPVVVSRRLPWRNRMEELFEEGVTCLAFDRPTHGPLDVADCVREVKGHLDRLTDQVENRRIGQAGRDRLASLMWGEQRPGDVESLNAFMNNHFGG